MKFYIIIFFFLFIFKFVFIFKNVKNDFQILEGKTMGTYWKISFGEIIEKKYCIYLKKLIQKKLNIYDNQLSTWKKDSIISKINLSQKIYKIDKYIADIISIALHFGAITDGTLDITVGNLVKLWGFEKNFRNTIPKILKIKHFIKSTGLNKIKIIKDKKNFWIKKSSPEVYINLSTILEGYLADRISNFLKKNIKII